MSTTFFKTLRGSIKRGFFVSGSKNDTRKNGTFFSHGIRLNVDRSIFAIRSRYPFSLFDIKSSREYTVSWMSQPLYSDCVSYRDIGGARDVLTKRRCRIRIHPISQRSRISPSTFFWKQGSMDSASKRREAYHEFTAQYTIDYNTSVDS